ncbi:cytochrome C biogenesis protein CcmF [Porphyromonas macacae]|uniref:dimethylarginine dimethylaminohydrolase family protein n=1 Tax=Porphyromonas macacae TaxID=28115 RepID=UPI00052BC932|nr:arginine deiminase family protein [Porphyromonas macacae]KGO00061.1 cytochrome C biogenesis protein CcmF [Porphyromonas macacae]
MDKFIPHVTNETARLKKVVLGLPDSIGPVPSLSETYDAKSYEAVEKGVFPSQNSIIREMNALLNVLNKYDVEVVRPEPLNDYNQVFARDVAFTIDNTLFVSNLIEDRAKETNAFSNIFASICNGHLERLPEKIHAEGGDVLLYDDILFIGTYLASDYSSYKTARTNQYAIDFFRERFPDKTIVPLQLCKHDSDPYRSVLHLDCAFQPVSKGRALIYRKGFLHENEVAQIDEIFGRDNLFEVTPEEAYYMNTNVFSISPEVIITEEKFVRLNEHLRNQWEMTVETVPYAEISKMGGLLRCSTMPLVRE